MKTIIWFLISWILIYLYTNNFTFIEKYNLITYTTLWVIFETIIILITYFFIRNKFIAVWSFSIIEYILYIIWDPSLILYRIITISFWIVFYLLWKHFWYKWLLFWIIYHLIWNITATLWLPYWMILNILLLFYFITNDYDIKQ